MDDILLYLNNLKEEYGEFVVYSDSSHPFNNLELENAGFDIYREGKTMGVIFSKWKEFGIGNLNKYFQHNKIALLKSMDKLYNCLQNYHRDKTGKPIKKNDHGPDALMIALLYFLFHEEFEDLVFQEQALKSQWLV